MKKEELKWIKKNLGMKRERIIAQAKADIKENTEGSADILDEMDLANVGEGLDFRCSLHERNLNLLRKIDQALERIEEGVFGICEECGEPIAGERIRAEPVATLCIDCKEGQEDAEKRFFQRSDSKKKMIIYYERE